MSARSFLGITAVLASVLVLSGCGAGMSARRYKAERLLWLAQRKENESKLRNPNPDSTTSLALRENYLRVAREVPPPYISGGKGEQEAGRQLLRTVADSRLQAARLAVGANRPDLALREMNEVAAMAQNDTLVLRRADFFRLATLRQYKRYNEALALMQDMLARYRPVPPAKPGEEDAVLGIPEAMVRMRRDLGDEAGAAQELSRAGNYYRGLLSEKWPPDLEVQIRSRLVRVDLEEKDWNGGLQQLEILRTLARTTPSMKALEPEFRYSEAKLLAMRDPTHPDVAVSKLDQVAKDYPKSRFAARATFEAGALLEAQGKKQEALEHYRAASTRFGDDPELVPLAMFRSAILEDQLGDWERAKIIFEAIPVRYPESRGAIEAPMAIVDRYIRLGQKDAAMQALRRAVTTYRSLIARDTTSSFTPVYRWSILRCEVSLRDWVQALNVVDEIVRHDMGHPLAAQALLEGGQIAHQHGQDDRARAYLQAFLANYPKSPLIPDIKREMEKLGKSRPKA